MWTSLFGLTNLIALAAWTLLVALPRRAFVLAAVLYLGVGLLCLAYTAMLVAVVSGAADPVQIAGAARAGLTNYSIPGIRALFASDGGLVIGWTHYLALDLFAGLWIARDADAKGFSRVVQVPFLLATFLAGPLGLLSWLIMRERRARKAAKAAKAAR